MWYADYEIIKEEKLELSESVVEYQTSIEEWIEFSNFKTQKKDFNWNKNLENIVSLLEKDFYSLSFQNIDGEYDDFNEFIENKKQETLERTKSGAEQEMKEIVNTVLPSYSIYDLWQETDQDFSELQFINYVEKIMQTFNLEYDWDIGMEEVLPLVEDSQENVKDKEPTDEELLASKIFYIPLKFEITWNKASIIDFLYFVEKVWQVEAKDWTLWVYSDTFFEANKDLYRNSDMTLEWDTRTSDYNPYLNQIIDIESLTFKSYIYEKKDWDTRNAFIANLRKLPQWFEDFEAEVVLRFYVKWVSDYQVEEKYKNIVQWIVNKKTQIDTATKQLAGLSIKQKTPEIVLLTKRLVSYKSTISMLEENLKKFKDLEAEKVYEDIFTSLEIQDIIENDLASVKIIMTPASKTQK